MAASTGAGARILARLRELMKSESVGALVVPSADPHMTEVVARRYARRGFITNFHGSAGTAVVTETDARLWTDGRYWLEAEASLYPGWTLMKDGLPSTPTVAAWLSSLPKGIAVGVDPLTVSLSFSREVILKATSRNLVDVVWSEEPNADQRMPTLPGAPIFPLDEKYAGQSAKDKLQAIAADLKRQDCDVALFSALDDVAWLFNLRGGDIDNSPIFYSYALVSKDAEAWIFLHSANLNDEARARLHSTDVKVHEYDELATALASFSGQQCLIDDRQISLGVRDLLLAKGLRVKPEAGVSHIKRLKALKNDVELGGFRAAHLRDGLALTCFLAWVENAVLTGAPPTECEAADQLEAFRRRDPSCVGLSFPTISGSGPNGAVIHYHAQRDTCRRLAANELYLVDSGGQYHDGTTDVTRTVCFGEPTALQRTAYTAVLQGVIAINTTVFPPGVSGHRIDAFARRALWQLGLDYAHGTGHGVGHFLNVHEGPHGIGVRPLPTPATLEARMIVSNEPGYYRDGEFGIRIENLEIIAARTTPLGGAPSSHLGFETLTLAPLCRRLVDVSMLSPAEVAWVNAYHDRVRSALEPLLPNEPLFKQYLTRETAPLVR